MENASKALVMAGSVLIGVLILSLMVTLFINARTVSKEHEATKNSEAIQQFNVNFIKYVGQDLTIHDVVTICNFAIENGFKEDDITGFKGKEQIEADIKEINSLSLDERYIGKKIGYIYSLTILDYTEDGYISKIGFSDRQLKVVDID